MNIHRKFCLLFLLPLLAASGLGIASAAFLTSDFPEKKKSSARPAPIPRIPDFRPPHPRPPIPRHENAAVRLLRQVDAGTPYRYQHLTIYPVNLNRGGDRSGLRSLDEALSSGWVSIEESGRARVSELSVRNTSRHSIFLMAGEAIHGGKQNRIITHDVILSPHSGLITIPVYCVEQHRWSEAKGKFQSRKNLAHPGLRSSAAKRAPQDSIWREVESRSKSAGVDVPTRNYESLYSSPSVKKQLAECIPHFNRFRGPETIGAVAVVGGRIVGADLFSDPDLFSKLWDKILRSYALEYISRPEVNFRDRRKSIAPQPDVRQFLDRAVTARYTSQSTPGAGTLYRISGTSDGETMIWNGHAAHVALFGSPSVHPRPPKPIPAPEPRPLPRPVPRR